MQYHTCILSLLVRLISQVLDARDPAGCRCLDVERYVRSLDPNKRIILLLNKMGKAKTWVLLSKSEANFDVKAKFFNICILVSSFREHLVIKPGVEGNNMNALIQFRSKIWCQAKFNICVLVSFFIWLLLISPGRRDLLSCIAVPETYVGGHLTLNCHCGRLQHFKRPYYPSRPWSSQIGSITGLLAQYGSFWCTYFKKLQHSDIFCAFSMPCCPHMKDILMAFVQLLTVLQIWCLGRLARHGWNTTDKNCQQ